MSSQSGSEPCFTNLFRPIERAAKDKASDLRWCQMATTGLDGTAKLRTLVLRGTDRDAHQLLFYTDRRSPKMAEIQARREVSCLFFSSAQQVQYRFSGIATIHIKNSLWQRHWDRLKPYARRDYASARAPGLTGETDYADALAIENFALIACRFTQLDWLSLSREGHQRYIFSWTGDTLTRNKIVP